MGPFHKQPYRPSWRRDPVLLHELRRDLGTAVAVVAAVVLLLLILGWL